MLTPPIQNADRELWRAALEAIAQFSPVTAALARIFQITHPSTFDRDLAKWRDEVAAAATDHEARLTALEALKPKIALSADALALATWIAQQSTAGLEDLVTHEEIRAAFPSASDRELQDAAAELEMRGLVVVGKAIGYPLRYVQPSITLFALFDPVVHGDSPQNDAARIARAALELDSGDARELDLHLGWPRRRFNPAYALLLTLVNDGHIRDAYQPDYPKLGFILAAEERVRFRTLLTDAGMATASEVNPSP